MKKLILAASVVAMFVLYSIHQRREDANAVVVPAAVKSSPTPAAQAPASADASNSPASSSAAASAYRDGQYTGPAANAYYGYIQVKAVIQGGQITDVQFLQYPNDRDTSRQINTQAMPYLTQEAIQAQSAHVDIISGATDSSQAFIESLGAALAKAQS
jgi:uncharacterized protein with FMN-binding domain